MGTEHLSKRLYADRLLPERILREESFQMHHLSRITFAIGSIMLMLLAVLLATFGMSGLVETLLHSWQDGQKAVVHAISYVVISMAVFDVAKYFMEEEVILSRGKQTLGEARTSLTKFITSIIIAVFVEGLVGIFETNKENPVTILYPASLLLVATGIVLALGIYQRLSVTAEREKKQENLTD
ncbi:hypothetical protein AmDm5_0739 [Acetobacter malorum]|nr:hypothetical protein AmDm5_0739 [Acetobacter malorum]